MRLDSGSDVGELQIVGAVGWHWVSGAGGCCSWSGRGGAARGVEYFQHLAMVNATGVITEGCMSVLVLKGFGLALASVALSARR
jgi:hypothetical protein